MLNGSFEGGFKMRDDKVKIFLNGDALNRLIGGDSELEVNLRHQVANNFAKNYLKSTVTEFLEDKIKDFAQKKLQDEFEEIIAHLKGVVKKVGNEDVYWYGSTLNELIKQKFQEKTEELNKHTESILRKHLTEKAIEEKIDYYFKVMINSHFSKAVEELVKNKLKEEISKVEIKINTGKLQ